MISSNLRGWKTHDKRFKSCSMLESSFWSKVSKCIFNISCKTEIFGVSAHLMQSENLSDLHEMGEDTLINVVCV